MGWIIALIKFIAAAVGGFSLLLFVLSCIMLVINPEIVTNEKGQAYEKHGGSRLWFALVAAIAWALVITL